MTVTYCGEIPTTCWSSVKWVGLFVTLLVGAYTIEDLWDKFGDLKMPVVSYLTPPPEFHV